MASAVDIKEVAQGIRRRAIFARMSALMIILFLTLIGTATALFFIRSTSGPTVYIGEGVAISNTNISAGAIEWISEVTKAFIRVGGVIMSVFVINILFSVAKYNLRVANYLDSRADSLLITNGEVDLLAKILPAISVDPLDFVRTPMSPYDTYLDTIKAIIPHRSSSPQADPEDQKSKSDAPSR